MIKRNLVLSAFAVSLIACSSSMVGAGEGRRGGGPDFSKGNPETASEAASGLRRTVEPFGVGVTPAVYLVNFLLAYITNPNVAANFPAYRVPVPRELADCLDEFPMGCPYSEFARFFDDSTNPSRNCSLPRACQTKPEWAKLAPDVARTPSQINEPLGLDRADSIARSLGIDKSMILTDREWQCTIGTSEDRTDTQDVIFACVDALTNSRGNTNISLSSYGLAIADPAAIPPPMTGSPAVAGDVQSLCAPAAPCLTFNNFFSDGEFRALAQKCGWETKLDLMQAKTPFLLFAAQGAACQEIQGGTQRNGACLAEPVCSSADPGR
jgi:hypothetical protein